MAFVLCTERLCCNNDCSRDTCSSFNVLFFLCADHCSYTASVKQGNHSSNSLAH